MHSFFFFETIVSLNLSVLNLFLCLQRDSSNCHSDSWSTSTGIPKSYANFHTISEMLPNISQVTQMGNPNRIFHSSMSLTTMHSSFNSHWFWVFYLCIFLHLFFSSFPMASMLGHILLTSNDYNTCWWSLPGNLNSLFAPLHCW